MAFLDYYRFLGLADKKGFSYTEKITYKEVQRAYRKKALELHPDKLTDPEKIAQAPALISKMAEAKETLCDPCKKMIYDKELAQHMAKNSTTDTVDATELSSSNVTNADDKTIPEEIAKKLAEYFFKITNTLLNLEGNKPEEFNAQIEFHKHIHGNTFLHLTLLSKKPYLAGEMILSCTEDTNAQNALGYTPLHYAAMLGYPEITGLLMEQGAKISTNHFGETPLHNALQEKHISVANVMLEKADKEEFEGLGKSSKSLSDLAKEACESMMTSECETLYAKLGIDMGIDADQDTNSTTTAYPIYTFEMIGEINDTAAY